MRFTSLGKDINPKEYGKAEPPLCFDGLAFILSRYIFCAYGKKSERLITFVTQRNIFPLHSLSEAIPLYMPHALLFGNQ